MGILNWISEHSSVFASFLILAKNVEIVNRQLSQSREGVCNGLGQELEFLIVEAKNKYNLQYHDQILLLIYSFGGKRSCPTYMRPY